VRSIAGCPRERLDRLLGVLAIAHDMMRPMFPYW
jgi:hypothetical protein